MCDLANLENLDGARLVRVFTSKEGDERVYAWFGGLMILIYDAELNEIDVFSFENGRLVEFGDLLKLVEQLIEVHEENRFMDEGYTDDIFYSHEYETGEELETQNSERAK